MVADYSIAIKLLLRRTLVQIDQYSAVIIAV